MRFLLIMAFLFLTVFNAQIGFADQCVSVVEPAYDFGYIPQGQLLEHVFIIQNKGDSPLTITSIKPSCGCTSTNSSIQVITPGGASEIKVTLNSEKYSGEISKTIAIETDDPKMPLTTLYLNGSIIEEVAVTPGQANLGVLKKGISREIHLSVSNKGKRTVKLLSVISNNPQISVKADRYIIEVGKTANITISALPDGSDRMLKDFITITTDNPSKGQIVVPVFASVIN